MTQRPSEDTLIARYLAPMADAAGLGLRDDAACLTPSPGHDLIVTTDALVESVHFLPEDAPGSIARKALGVNVSDLAAKGAKPRGFLLGLALPTDWTEEWLKAFSMGLGEAAKDFGCPLLGGDTVKTKGPLVLSVTALGEVPVGLMVQRTKARPGDMICVSGTIGDAALGLILRRQPAWADALTEPEKAFLADRYLHPQPRHALAHAIRVHANASMDVSDGFAGDLAKLFRASGVTGWVDVAKIPLSQAAGTVVHANPELLERALTGGDDYEILCTVPKDHIADFLNEAQRIGVAVSVVGQVEDGAGLPVFRFGQEEKRFEAGSYSHF